MRLDYRWDRWVFECEYEDRLIPKAARFMFDFQQKIWYTRSARCASGLILYATDEARKKILDKLYNGPQHTTAPAKSSARRVDRSYRHNI